MGRWLRMDAAAAWNVWPQAVWRLTQSEFSVQTVHMSCRMRRRRRGHPTRTMGDVVSRIGGPDVVVENGRARAGVPCASRRSRLGQHRNGYTLIVLRAVRHKPFCTPDSLDTVKEFARFRWLASVSQSSCWFAPISPFRRRCE